jgi:glycosyltransferase involved in cell wall biosynthesis
MPQSLTVVIPALNEAERLPALLDALATQTVPPQAIVVADAGSTDGTADIARAAGAVVVPGGLPGPGRNAGAAVATTALVLFLDADVMPDDDFIEIMLREFARRELKVATTLLAPLESSPGDVLACEVANLYLQLVQHVSPHAAGFCILVDRALHERIGGFDETVVLAEDHDYVQRAAKHGAFAVICETQIPVSMRRIRKEGLVRIAFKYVYCEMYALTGTPIHTVPFDYEFGSFERPEGSVALMDIASLRQRLGTVARAFEGLTDSGRRVLERLGATEVDQQAFERLLGELPSSDVARLDEYLRTRRRAASELRARALGSARQHSEVLLMRVREEFEQLRR